MRNMFNLISTNDRMPLTILDVCVKAEGQQHGRELEIYALELKLLHIILSKTYKHRLREIKVKIIHARRNNIANFKSSFLIMKVSLRNGRLPL